MLAELHTRLWSSHIQMHILGVVLSNIWLCVPELTHWVVLLCFPSRSTSRIILSTIWVALESKFAASGLQDRYLCCWANLEHPKTKTLQSLTLVHWYFSPSSLTRVINNVDNVRFKRHLGSSSLSLFFVVYLLQRGILSPFLKQSVLQDFEKSTFFCFNQSSRLGQCFPWLFTGSTSLFNL